jgi:hypothetical protein
MLACGTALACLAPAAVIAQEAHVASAEIAGHVLSTDGSPVGGVAVSLIGVSDLETDSSGAFHFLTLPPGTYFLRATRIGAKPVLKNVTVAEDERIRVDVTLSSSAHELTAVIDAQSIKGIELYRGPATTPPELRSPKTVCGTLAIWTR